MIPLHLTFADGSKVEVDARPFAIELWERDTKQKMFGLAEGAGMGDLMRIAYHELKLSGETLPKYDDWAATVVGIVEESNPKADAPQA
jgi:hypothetical protein